jgi:regulator of sirC expression with transglutaminase-like and TPR domain
MNFVQRFAQELSQPTPRSEHLALAIAGMADGSLDFDDCLHQLDEFAAAVDVALAGLPPGRTQAERFLQVLMFEFGFVGNRENYYDPANSFLHIVLRERVGLPIMLSLVCMAVGRRLGMDVSGVGFPGHFMARYQDEAGAWLLDLFNGEVIECTDADHYLSQIFERPIVMPAEMHRAISAPALARRILNNLRNVYLSRGDYPRAAQVLDYLVVLEPVNPEHWLERGLLNFYSEQWEDASRDLKRFFYFKGWLLQLFGRPATVRTLASNDQSAEQLLQTYWQIEETRRRIN